jgi:predicted aldo/keto reductase-like oxidoreductase
MSSVQILESNVSSVENFRELTEEELASYAEVITLFKKSYKINCTGCNYCLPCPKGISIPDCLTLYNTSYMQGYVTGLILYVNATGIINKNNTSLHLCNNCGICEKKCPQNLPIRKELKRVARRFESLPLRGIFAIVRKVLG